MVGHQPILKRLSLWQCHMEANVERIVLRHLLSACKKKSIGRSCSLALRSFSNHSGRRAFSAQAWDRAGGTNHSHGYVAIAAWGISSSEVLRRDSCDTGWIE